MNRGVLIDQIGTDADLCGMLLHGGGHPPCLPCPPCPGLDAVTLDLKSRHRRRFQSARTHGRTLAPAFGFRELPYRPFSAVPRLSDPPSIPPCWKTGSASCASVRG